MSYYAALVSLIQLLKEINHRGDHRFYTLVHISHVSLCAELSNLQAILKYSPEYKQVADVCLENRITDLAYEAQDIIETRVSGLDHEVYSEEKLEEVKRDVGFLVEELMRIKENRKSHEDNDSANSTAGASTQAAVPKDGTSTVRSSVHFCAGLVSHTIRRLEGKSRDIPPHYVLFKEQIASLIEILSHFQLLIRDYSPKDIAEEAANSLKIRIQNTTNGGNNIIMPKISASLEESLQTKYTERLDKMKREADSIATELIMMLSIKCQKLNSRKATLFALVQLLEEITHNDQYYSYPHLDKAQIASLHAKFGLLLQLLVKGKSVGFEERQKGIIGSFCGLFELLGIKEWAGFVERRIRVAAFETQYIIETHMSHISISNQNIQNLRRWEIAYQDLLKERANKNLKNVEDEVDSIWKEMTNRASTHAASADDVLVPVVQLLKKISHSNQCPDTLDIENTTFLHQKFEELQELLDKKKPVGFLERRIIRAAFRTRDIIGTHISLGNDPLLDFIFLESYYDLRELREEVLSIVETMMKEFEVRRLTTHQDNSGNIAGASTQAPSDGTTATGMEFHEQLTIKARAYGESSKLEAVPIVGMERFATNEDNFQENRSSENSAGPSTQAPIIDCTARTSKVQAPSDRSTMVGFDENLNAIKEQLCGEPPKLQVVSIVGMGGIGKTTWAKNIFNDKLIYERFHCRAWVVVSQDYHLRNILLDIASSFKNDIEELRGVEENMLKQHIYQYLYGSRYLIIMDDVWHEKLLDDLKRIIPDNDNGSRIMITTRESKVALYGCREVDLYGSSTSRFIHQIPFLDEYQSWNLFCQSQKVSFYPPIPENIGRSIVKKCRGLPLAIVVVAGLPTKLGRLDWKEIERDISSIAKNDEYFSKILSLSYNFLPHHLKPCFLYFGGFPEDDTIHASLLIKTWIAEGFVEPTESKSMEEVAEMYLEDLVSRNLVSIRKKKSSGKIKYCSIHDLLRDLCLRILSYEKFLHVLDKNSLLLPEDIRNVRRLHISHTDPFLCLDQMKELSRSVRSIYSFADVGDGFLTVVSDFKLLRVLNAVDTRSSTSPDEIVELLHLRYLRLLYLPVTPSISKLQNLQTLVLGGETILPSEIWKMPHLRHVIIPRMTLPPIPQGEVINDGVPLLGKLQTLSTVMDFIFTSDTVEMIPSLKKLQVVYNEAYKSWDAFGLNDLVHLTQLQTLNIEFSLGETSVDILVGPLPLNFAFPENLKTLSLSGCRRPWSDMTVVGSLPNLEVLKLRLDAFLGEDWKTIQGEFPKLKFLLMEKLFYLEYWRVETTHFPCLEHLIIRDCGRLQEIPSEIGDISTLELIEAYGSKLAAESALRIKVEQSDNGNDDLQVCIG